MGIFSLSFNLRRRHHDHRYRHHIRTLFDGVANLQFPADRGLDHAVERERHVKPVINLKNFIISEPSKSVPLNLITQSKENLEIPFRPVDFIRKYPSVFQEFHHGSLNFHPHIKLTPKVLSLNSEENLLYQSMDYKQDVANRLLKLLMIGRVNQIPILLLERLKWELGLPHDYEKTVIPEFPDYFRVNSGKNLELVCWTDELAVSEMEKKASKDGNIQFILEYSKGFEMDKKYKKWVDDWQKLPYVSPYDNATHLAAKTDESDKWAAAVLHEVLNLFVGKKAERESLFALGECLGLRSRFKLALLQHPGIFYVSSKIRMHTVVLRDGYKRGMLIERHPLMPMRFKYAYLMNVVKDVDKSKTKTEKTAFEGKKGEEEEEEGAEDFEGDNDENDNYSDGESDSENVNGGGRFRGKNADFREKGVEMRRNVRRSRNVEDDTRRMYAPSSDNNDRNVNRRGRFRGSNVNVNGRGRFRGKNADFNKKDVEMRKNVRRSDDVEDDTRRMYDNDRNVNRRGRFRGSNVDSEENVKWKRSGRMAEKNGYESPTRFSGRRNSRGGGNRTGLSRDRVWLKTEKSSMY